MILTEESAIKRINYNFKWMGILKEFLILRNDLYWSIIIYFTILHIGGLYALFNIPFLQSKITLLYLAFTILVYAFGLAAGVHRYWSHRSFKAKWPLRLLMAFGFYGSVQLPMHFWVRVHRTHHKYSDTDGDPHNSTRGFFFAHIGWTMVERHPEALRRMKETDVSDIRADPIIKFGDKHYLLMAALCSFIIPTVIPVYFWNESWKVAILSQIFLRNLYVYHATATLNSVAHLWGTKPYDKKICPVESKLCSKLTFGEGWHNYHHTFPWDYKGAEYSIFSKNMTTCFINMFASIGWAYDLKQPSKELIKMTCQNRGDNSHENWKKIEIES